MQYYGFHPYHGTLTELGHSWAGDLPRVDANDKAITDVWQYIFRWTYDLFSIPNNKPPTLLNGTQAMEHFFDQTLFMIVRNYNEFSTNLEDLHNNNIDFDINPEPSWEAYPDLIAPRQFHQLVMNSETPHPDQAFQVMDMVLSDQVQTLASQNARMTVLTNPAVQEQFGVNNPYLEGINTSVLFMKRPPHPSFDRGPYGGFIDAELRAAFQRLYIGESADINTALREAAELANQKIDFEKTQRE